MHNWFVCLGQGLASRGDAGLSAAARKPRPSLGALGKWWCGERQALPSAWRAWASRARAASLPITESEVKSGRPCGAPRNVV